MKQEHQWVLRVMNKYNLLSKSRRKRKWVQNCESIHKYTNLLERNFYAERPNLKWCTDISYIPTKEGFVYLSVIKDLYDNFVVAYKVGTEKSYSTKCFLFRVHRLGFTPSIAELPYLLFNFNQIYIIHIKTENGI